MINMKNQPTDTHHRIEMSTTIRLEMPHKINVGKSKNKHIAEKNYYNYIKSKMNSIHREFEVTFTCVDCGLETTWDRKIMNQECPYRIRLRQYEIDNDILLNNKWNDDGSYIGKYLIYDGYNYDPEYRFLVSRRVLLVKSYTKDPDHPNFNEFDLYVEDISEGKSLRVIANFERLATDYEIKEAMKDGEKIKKAMPKYIRDRN